MKRLSLVAFLVNYFMLGCSTRKEVFMPFRNFSYSAERLFPIKENNADFTFRASVNFSTNIDRVFTISKDSISGCQGNIIEITTSPWKQRGKPKVTYNQKNTIPKSGFEIFISKVDSLNLLDYQNQKEIEIPLHQPFSLYVIEIKYKGRYNQFKFNTINANSPIQNKYSKIEKLIRKEFDMQFYFTK